MSDKVKVTPTSFSIVCGEVKGYLYIDDGAGEFDLGSDYDISELDNVIKVIGIIKELTKKN